MHCSRRSALTLLAGASVGALAGPVLGQRQNRDAGGSAANPGSRPAGGDSLPVNGRVLPGLEALDGIVVPVMEAHAIPGAAIAITQGGALKVARGYGFADVAARVPMRPETFVALASVSKVFTAQTILKLVDTGQLRLSDRVFDYFREPPPPGMREDPRLSGITVEMCLHHTGGWDRKASGDPSAWGPRIARALDLAQPPGPLEMIRYMKGVPLDFAPGTRQVYSNFGFVLLGSVIGAVTRTPYPEYIRQRTLPALGATGVRLDDVPPRYLPGEAKRYVAGNDAPVAGGNSRMVMASGGWQAHCVDMARVMTAIDGTRTGTPFLSPAMLDAMLQPAPGITPANNMHHMGLGWDLVQAFPDPADPSRRRYAWGKDGGLAGIETYVLHRPGGVNLVFLFNSSTRADADAPGGLALIKPKVVDFVEQLPAWPAGDLFASFR